MMEIFQELRQVELQEVTSMIVEPKEDENTSDLTVSDFQRWLADTGPETNSESSKELLEEGYEVLDKNIITNIVDRINKIYSDRSLDTKLGFVYIDFINTLEAMRKEKIKNK